MTNCSITAAKGFLAAGTACGIKESGKPDLAILVCPSGAKAAAVFTTNKIVSAAVQVSRHHIKSAQTSGVIVNSGNANACTGKRGIIDAITMCRALAKETKTDPHKVLVASTGIIGHQLLIGKIISAVPKLFNKLSNNQNGGEDFLRAIMTTDTKMKCAIRKFAISGKKDNYSRRYKRCRYDWPQYGNNSVLYNNRCINLEVAPCKSFERGYWKFAQ